MFKTIVVGTDGSTNAEEAVRTAAAIARDQDAKLHVVSAMRPLTPGQLAELERALPEEFSSQLNADYFGEDRLNRAVRACKALSVTPVTHMISSDPADAILDIAEANGADLVVVGSRGEGTAKRLLHGSVSTKVLHHAPCSTLVVRDN